MGHILLLLLLVVISGTIAMQIYLSLKENRLLGMILPLFTLSLSILVFLSALIFNTATITSTMVTGAHDVQQTSSPTMSTTTDYVRAAFLLLYCNIPTMLLLAIYAACGGRRNKLRETRKLNAHDYY